MIGSCNLGPLVTLLDAVHGVSLPDIAEEDGEEGRRRRVSEVGTLQPLVHARIETLRGWTRVSVRGCGSSVPDGVYEHAQSGMVACVEMKLLRPPWLLSVGEPTLDTPVLGVVSVEGSDVLDDESALLSIHEMAMRGSRGVQPRRPSDYRTVRDWETVLAASSSLLASGEAIRLLRPEGGRRRVLTYLSTVAGVVEGALGQARTYARNLGCERSWHVLAVVAVYLPGSGRTRWFVDYGPPGSG
jgi:hypothetical protein